MTISFPLPTLKGHTNLLSYSTNPEDHPTLDKLSNLVPRLSRENLTALVIVVLYEGFEPESVEVSWDYRSNILNRCIELIQDLSQSGKVALVRSIAELLAVSLRLQSQPRKISLPPVLTPLSKEQTNECC